MGTNPEGSDLAQQTRPGTTGRRWADAIIISAFALASGRWLLSLAATPGAIGFDAKIYVNAARAMLEGGDPWQVSVSGAYFAGPPTSLLPFVPLTPLPDAWVAPVAVAVNLTLAVWVIRRLRLPGWWLGFPPLFYAVVLGSSEVLVLALLLCRGELPSVAVAIKPYAVLPLVGERRWSAIAAGVFILVASLLLLPWDRFLTNIPQIAEHLVGQSHGENVFGSPVLMVVGLASLAALGWRRGFWLAGPLLIPSPQWHYAVTSMPVVTAAIALAWSLPIPQAMLVGLLVQVAIERWPRFREAAWPARAPASDGESQQ